MGVACASAAQGATVAVDRSHHAEVLTMNDLRAYHDSQELKDHFIARVRAHRLADTLIQGTGWERGKGCAVGCTLEAYDHTRYPIELGIPEVLAYLLDRIFEGLARAEYETNRR